MTHICSTLSFSLRRGPRSLNSVLVHLLKKASPVLFAVTMGTGSISNIFAVFPYGYRSTPMLVFCLIFFFLNIFIFCLFTILLTTKYSVYPRRLFAMLNHPVTSLYLGCFPMGATTIINVAVQVVNLHYDFGGKPLLYILWAMWWINVVLSILFASVGVHVMIAHQSRYTLQDMTAAWLLPVVTVIVCSSSGNIFVVPLQAYSEYHALVTSAVSAFMVIMGITLAMMILTIYLLRLIVYGLPKHAAIISVFLPLGPTGQSGYSLLLAGHNFRSLIPINSGSSEFLHSTFAAQTIDAVCTSLAFCLWTLATMWALYGLLAILARTIYFRQRIPFHSNFWGLVFPNGVYANLTLQLAATFDSRALRVYGSIYSGGTVLLWCSLVVQSVRLLRTTFNESITEPCHIEEIKGGPVTCPRDSEIHLEAVEP